MAGQLWAVDSLGGRLYAKRLSKELRTILQPMWRFRQFCDVKDEVASGKGKGDTYTFDCVFNVQTQGGTLVETNTMPETNFKILQNSGSVYEYGNAVPWTKKLEAMSQFNVRRPVMQALRNDAAKVLDSAAFDQFALSPLTVCPAAGNSSAAITIGSASTGATANNLHLTKSHVRLIADTMQERNIPYYDGSNYIAIGRPTTFSTLKGELEGVRQYVVEGYKMIANGEIGKFENVRFVTQTQIAAAAEGTWGNAKSDWVMFFGEETVCEGIAEPENMISKIPEDYGRSKGVAWYYLGGFQIKHNWDTTVDTGNANTRIIKWTSPS